MAFKNFRPDFDYLKSLGFKETNTGDGMSFTNTLRMYENEEPNKFIIDNGSSILKEINKSN